MSGTPVPDSIDNMTVHFFKKYYRVLSVIPGIGTLCAVSKMILYGLHGTDWSSDTPIGVLLDTVFPGKTLVKMTILVMIDSIYHNGFEYLKNKMQSSRKNIVDDDRDKIDFNNEHCLFIDNEVATQDDIANSLRIIFHFQNFKRSSYYGHISYSSYIENRMIIMTFSDDGGVSLFLNFDKDASKTKKNYIKIVNGVLGLNRETDKYSFGKDQDYYNYEFFFQNLQDVVSGKTILVHGEIFFIMKNLEDKTVAESRLRINTADNFFYIKNLNNHYYYFVPEKNESSSQLVFKRGDKFKKFDALFYFANDRIYH
ncbi:2780_t:CDS:2 [Dentiscutata heterogama]|uniref:2780_t:CDS:1 n=1 Tax=Dentiscutata heterogama TaxID=1316150 RepID=A0ACA9LAZ0_9GLOM|nr:2780_t:CDS:2 [Dentiscutata heterogama]